MDFGPSETQTAITDLAKRVFKDRCTATRLAEIDATAERFDAPLWKQLAVAGLLGAAIPEEHGGSGGGFLELCSLLEQAGAAAAPVPLWPVLALAAAPIARFGTAEQKGAYLRRIAGGEAILTLAFTELDAPNPRAPDTSATRSGDAWIVDGVKDCVPAAYLSERILVPARTGADSLAVFLVDPKSAGVTVDRQTATGGAPLARVTLNRCRVAAADVLGGDPAGGGGILAWLIPRARAALCAMQLGVARRVLRMTARYTAERVQFDRPIATFQAVAHRAADAYIDVEAMRLTTWEAAWRLSEELDADDAVDIAAFWACEAGHRVAFSAQHLHGGIGYDLDYPLGRYYPITKQIELFLGGANATLEALGGRAAPAA